MKSLVLVWSKFNREVLRGPYRWRGFVSSKLGSHIFLGGQWEFESRFGLIWLFNAKSPLYIYIEYIWFGLGLWHINHCRLFNTKFFFYIYIEYIWFGLVGHINYGRLFNGKSFWCIYIYKYIWFYLVGFSTMVGYLMANPFDSYILNINDLLTHFVVNIFKWFNLISVIFLHTFEYGV